jgi:hypothetical protein
MDALSLVVLHARTGSSKFEPAAMCWLVRLALDGATAGRHQLAAAALASLHSGRREPVEKTLLRLLLGIEQGASRRQAVGESHCELDEATKRRPAASFTRL